jgi:ABC-type sugar transport system ATPase subunit
MEVIIDRLRFSRAGRRILSINSLQFPHGSTTALFGPNGSGKTTLLSLLAGLEQPDSGHIAFGERAPREFGTRWPVALAFQRPVFIRGSVRANLALGLTLADLATPVVTARVGEAATAFGIAELLDRSARALSGGEAQRANLARALCLKAPITLLDEPLAGLDRLARGRLLDELPALLQAFATTSVIVTHDREEAFRLADRLVVLVDGEVRAAGASGEIYRKPPDPLTAELLGYTVLSIDGRPIAVPPGGLVVGPGSSSLRLTIGRVVDMGNHLHLLGELAGKPVTVRLAPGQPIPDIGSRVEVVLRGEISLTD